MERTLIIVKPDGVQRGLTGAIISRLENRGLKLVGMKLLAVSDELARRHYAIHEGKPFFPGLITYITSSPVVVIAAVGTNAVKVVRQLCGATNPVDAGPGTIRGDFGLEIGRNLIHASDSIENGQQEVALWFEPAELIAWERANDRWIYE